MHLGKFKDICMLIASGHCDDEDIAVLAGIVKADIIKDFLRELTQANEAKRGDIQSAANKYLNMLKKKLEML
jgi:hypothetical protein